MLYLSHMMNFTQLDDPWSFLRVDQSTEVCSVNLNFNKFGEKIGQKTASHRSLSFTQVC